MKINNILLIVGSTGDSNLAFNYAKTLQKKYNVFFATASRASYKFLKEKEADITFFDLFEKKEKIDNKKLIYFEKKYLLSAQKTLEKIKFSDRNYYNMDQKTFNKSILNLFEEVESFLSKKKIDLCFSQISSSAVVRISHCILKESDKKHVFLDGFPLEKTKFIISDIDESLNSSVIDYYWNSLKESDINKKNIDQYNKRFIEKNSMIYPPVVPKFFEKKNINSLLKILKEFERKGHSSFFKRVLSQINKIKQSKLSKLRIKYEKVNKKDKYIFFPIHVSEDAQILTRNDHYFNQLELIKIISRCLPYEYKLYIKEHPNNIGGIGIKTLKEIKKIQNVKLIDPLENSQNIIQNSQGVIMINGSAGLETVMRKKPLIVLGDVFYGKGENIYKLESLKNITKAINWLMQFKFNEKGLTDFSGEFIKKPG